MKLKFWSSLFVSVFFPLLVVCASGLYFMQFYENQIQEKSIKEGINQEQFFYLQSLEAKISFLEKEVQSVFQQKEIKDESSLLALMVWDDSQKEITEEYFLDHKKSPFKKESDVHQFRAFVKHFERPYRDSFQFDTLSFEKTNKKLLIVLERDNSKSKKDLIFAVLKDSSFFQISSFSGVENLKKKKVFLVNRKGRLFFHNDSQHLFKVLPKKSLVRESIEDLYYSRNKTKWFLETFKSKNRKEIVSIQKWKGKGAFLVSKRAFSPPLFFSSSWSLKWGLFCLALFFLICIGLFFTVSPLFSAYNYLKSFFIYFSKTGKAPSWGQNIKNPYLYFYNNRSEQIQSFQKKQNVSDDHFKSETFQDLLESEVKKLKFKYPGLRIIGKFESNVKLFGFENFMKTILRELLLNAVESMGAYAIQDIVVTTKEENEQFIFSVKDAGVGLLEGKYNKVFQLYYSTKSQLGVGLNLVQSIVHSNNGTVEFSTASQQKGLEVIVTLPLSCFLKVATDEKGKVPSSFKRDLKAEESSQVSP